MCPNVYYLNNVPGASRCSLSLSPMSGKKSHVSEITIIFNIGARSLCYLFSNTLPFSVTIR